VKPIKQQLLLEAIALLLHPAEPTQSRPVITRHSIAEAKIQNALILLAEDNDVNQLTATRILKKAGYSVEVAENGRAAVEAVARKCSTDLMMSRCPNGRTDGHEEIRKLESEGAQATAGSSLSTPGHRVDGPHLVDDQQRCVDAAWMMS